MWESRVQDALRAKVGAVLIVATEDWGVRRLFSMMQQTGDATVWLDLVSLDGWDPISVGDALRRGLRRSFGLSLYGGGLPYTYGLEILRRNLSHLAPLELLVSGAHLAPDFIKSALTMFGPPNRVVAQWADSRRAVPQLGDWQVISEEDLRLRGDEAQEMYGHAADSEAIAEATVAGGGALVRIEFSLFGTSSRSAVPSGTDPSLASGTYRELEIVFDTLVARRKWVPSFEVAVSFLHERIPEVIEEAVNALLEAGEFKRLWGLCQRIPAWLLRDEEVLLSVFASSIAVNEWRPYLPQVDEVLAGKDAPRLRCLRETVAPRAVSLALVRKAYHVAPCSETAKSLGFLEALHGDPAHAIPVLQEAIALAEAEGRPRHLVSAANSAALASLSTGSYRGAKHWSSWALRRFQGFALNEELLRLSVLNLAAYSRLLSGTIESAEQILSSTAVSADFVGIPGMEGVLSTFGDLHLVRDDPDASLGYYRPILERASRSLMATAANDTVRALCVAGRAGEAQQLAEEVFEQVQTMGPFQAAVGAVALGTAHMLGDRAEAERVLGLALERLLEHPFGPIVAQVAAQLSYLKLERGDIDGARSVLHRSDPFVRELSPYGWKLLGAICGCGEVVMHFANGSDNGVALRFLGARAARIDGNEVNLSLRHAELLCVLACRPEGLRAEELALELYRDRARPGTLKSTISRVRRHVNIAASPYRLASTFRADFLDVLRHLEAGRLDMALSLCKGPLLPESDAPGVVEAREHIEESLRQAVLASRDPEALIHLATRNDGDLELWEEAARWLSSNDPRRPLVNARIRRIRRSWEDDARLRA